MPKCITHKENTKTGADSAAQLTMSVPAAGKHYYNLERQASYSAAHRGDIITVRVGGRLRAIKAAMDAKMARITEAALAKLPDA
jgi:hypothetical protein